MDSYVMDASVGVKWLFDETMSEIALKLEASLQKGEIKILVPELFFCEIANVCWQKRKRKMTSWEGAVNGFDRIVELPLKCISDREVAALALENALIYGVSVYDSFYLSLAEIYTAPLITADEALYKTCHKKFDFIEYLGNL